MNHNIISVSGGKDSTATLLLALERNTENLQAVFCDTGHEHPEVYAYLDYLELRVGMPIRRIKPDFSEQALRKRDIVVTKWRDEGVSESIIERALSVLRPTGNPFLDLCLWKGRFPSTMARFCTEELKRNPMQQQVLFPLLVDHATEEVWSWQGVRADESPSRSKLPEKDEVRDGLINYRPILTWTAQDVFDFHRKHGVKWNPLYEQGLSRVGCMPCIMCRKDELREIANRWPEEIERVAEWERLVSMASKRGASSFYGPRVAGGGKSVEMMTHEEAQEVLNINRVVEWSMTGRGGKTFDMFARLAPDVGCSSAYGLCDSPVFERQGAIAIQHAGQGGDA
ncbi:phosphoadenosine phosphosulfate reductase family protein [Aeromonas rivipollensis]|uniref:phosphoadenosine phosphosulfate reductase family protein n=1 Tax=Aeromonas rivipollensis TaxID=948519 RepID=UPI00259E0A2F|nr:phosphoadenosine phosphosulfate reductase family protein [Aeromonas rivipollensis]MDM5094405.1 phosphoadenosine phosphosulfate reductase family protein [Aeromonas rivipollensis]